MLHSLLALAIVAVLAVVAMADVVLDLNAEFNSQGVLERIDGLLKLQEGISRTSGVQVAWMPWGQAPRPVKQRAAKPHPDTAPVIRVSVWIHVNTPMWCLAVDGSIHYYIFLDNTKSRIEGVVDGWDTQTDNISACSGGVNDRLRNLVPENAYLVQLLIGIRLSPPQLPDRHYGSYYLLHDHVRLVLEEDTIVSRWNDLCMDVRGGDTANGALIQQWECNQSAAQKYYKIMVGDGYFMILNGRSGKCVAISEGATGNDALIAQYDCNSADLNHQWRSTDPGGNTIGAKWLINRNSGKCVAVPAWSGTPGTLLTQEDCVGGWKHYWYNV